MALPFVIVPALSLKSALMMSLFISAATIPTAVIAPLIKDKVKPMLLPPIYCFVAMMFVLVARLSVAGQLLLIDGLGIYIPLAALNGIMLHLAIVSPRDNATQGLLDSVLMCLGFTLVACAVGAFREILGSRTIWDIPFAFYPIRLGGVLMPFFGFIAIGFLNAAFRSLDRIVIGNMLAKPPKDERILTQSAEQDLNQDVKAGEG